MSGRSTRQKRKAKRTYSRPKSAYPTARRAWDSIEIANPELHWRGNRVKRHTGTYWSWEVLS